MSEKKIELVLAPFTEASLVAAFERLTGRPMTAEGIAKLRAELEQASKDKDSTASL